MSAEKVRAMLTENLERVRKASDEYFKLLEKGLSSSQLPIAGQAKPSTDFMQRNVTATFDLSDKLIKPMTRRMRCGFSPSRPRCAP
jgi:hypothetical protein